MNPANPAPATSTPTESADAPFLLHSDEAGVTTLTLNRPKHFNALSEEMLDALQTALDGLNARTRVVVIAAQGRAFCAGHDLKQMRANPSKNYYDALFQRCSRLMQTIIELPQPVIAKVDGIATAAGCQLVAQCDLAIASQTSRFAVSGINVGLFCSTPAVPLSRNVGRKQAFEMLMTGEFASAEQARKWGLINHAVPVTELDARVQQLCAAISAKSAVAVSTGKSLYYRQLELPLSEAYALAGETMACNMMTEDVSEGIDAFIGKRTPEWVHR